MNEERKKALELAMGQIEKKYGKGAVMRLGEHSAMNVEAVSTGSISLDIALGIGGIPKGRIVEIFGPESSGKTTVALHITSEIQKNGGTVAFIDAEHALDPKYARALGVNTDELIVSQPDNGEQALEIAECLVRSGAVELVVVDSVAALVPKQEIEDNMGDAHVGLQARLMSQALRKLSGLINKSNTIVVFINQLRATIATGGYGGPTETTTGGRALKFYASVRIDVRRIATLKDTSGPIGNRTRAKIVKNKVAPPFKIAEFDIMYGQGISKEGDLIDLGIMFKLCKKSGSWFNYGDIKLGQGRESARQYFKDNPQDAERLKNEILAKIAAEGTPDAVEGSFDDGELDAE
ncbi:MAG: recombinase RecA [Clostridia bacterium]|nr:recombinase RecA [Clostridia bacterium]